MATPSNEIEPVREDDESAEPANVNADTSDPGPPTDEEAAQHVRVADDSWRNLLIHKLDHGKETDELRANVANVTMILEHDPQWEGVIAYDEFAEDIITLKAPMWRSCDLPEGGANPGDWAPADTTRLQAWLSHWYRIDVGADAVMAAVHVVSLRHRIHPVRDWLDSLRWDGKKRLTTWLVSVMGCDDNEYVRAVGQAWAVSAVARIYEPGCKVDTVLVLEGKPGIFKSSVLRALVGDEWFFEMSVGDVGDKDAMQILRRKWIGEFPEIDSLSRYEQAHVKSYFSRQVDRYRPSFGKSAADFPRQAVFAATTNRDDYVTDETGGSGRRLWPVRCRLGDVGLARAMRDQLWAEARARYQSGEKWHITDPEIRDAASAEQAKRMQGDAWEGPIANWLASPSPPPAAAGPSADEILEHAIRKPLSQQTETDQKRVCKVLRRLGWEPGGQSRIGGERVRWWVKKAASDSVADTEAGTESPTEAG